MDPLQLEAEDALLRRIHPGRLWRRLRRRLEPKSAADQPPPLDGEKPPSDDQASLFHNRNYMALWLELAVSRTANTAVQFVLLILVVEKTGSSIATSGLIISLAAPPVVFGLISGTVVDRMDKRTVIMTTNLVRAGLTALLVIGDGSTASIFVIAFLTATAGQFNLPAANAAVPSYVPRSQLMAANSFFQLTVAASQLLGMIMLAPLMLKVFGFHASYIVGAVLIAATIPAVARLPKLPPGLATGAETWRHRLRSVPGDTRTALAVIRSDRITTLAMLQLSTGGMLLFMFALLVPRFLPDVLDIDADNAVFVFWPLGLGALIALRFLPPLGRRYTATGIVTVGLFGLALSTGAFAGINFVVDFLQEQQPFGALGPDQVGGLSLLVILTLVFAFPMGIAYALVNAPAQTVLHERSPQAVRGRIFATQLMLANAISMVALVVVGAMADVTSVEAAMGAVALMTVVMGLVSVYIRRHVDDHETTVPESVGSTGGGSDADSPSPTVSEASED
jgi:MFS family permease